MRALILSCCVVLLLLQTSPTHSNPTRTNSINSISALRSCLAANIPNFDDWVFVEYNPNSLSMYADLNYQWEQIIPYRTPAAYIVPRTAADVQAAVRCARPLGIPLVPKGGGHSYEKYSYSHTRDGESSTVIVDMKELNQLQVNVGDRTFTIGAGALLAQIAWPLYANYGFTTPHGTCPTVGIAGLALGGGYGYLSRLYGLTTDAIRELQVVNADGELLTVNANTNSNLFWALKGAGGSGSYGIVTQLKMQAFAAPKQVIFGIATYPLEEYPNVFTSWQTFIYRFPPRRINSKFSINNGEVVVEIFDVQLEEATGEGIELLRSYFNTFPHPPNEVIYTVYDYPAFIMKTMHAEAYGVQRPEDFVHLTRHSQSPKRFKAKSFFVDTYAGEVDIANINTVLAAIPVKEDIIVEVYAFGGAINDGEAYGQSSFMHRAQTMYLVQAFYQYRPGAQTRDIAAARSWLGEFFGVGKSVMKSTGSYSNYADGELADYLERYYGWNLNRLMEVKRNVDPTNYWRSAQSIPLWY